MKKSFLKYLFLLLFPIACHAQNKWITVDTVCYKFNYAIKYTKFEGRNPWDDEVVVEIGKHHVCSYGYWDRHNTLAYDSILSHGGTVADYLAKDYPLGWYDKHIIKNYPQKGKLTCTLPKVNGYIYTEPMAKKEWTLVEGDTIILDQPCKKATCTFRNRSWNVWYAPNIPISEGPWKLDGLPGMILKAEDTKYQFCFECINIVPNVNYPMIANLDKRIKTTPIYIERLYKLAASNDEAFKKLVGDKSIGGPKPVKRTACLLEYYEPNKK